MKTLKQIKNLKAYKEGRINYIWTAKHINGNWTYNWYDITDFEENNEEYLHKIAEKLEYQVDDERMF